LPIQAQSPADLRSEQVALSLRESAVERGDTLEVEGQVTCLAADRLLPYSNYLYLECISASDSMLVRQKISCKDGGHFNARIPVEYDWGAGVYCIRAYTRLMMNFSTDAFCVHPFLVGRKLPPRESGNNNLKCRIAAVGGQLIGGCMQQVAVCLTDGSGFPISRPINLTTSEGDTITNMETSVSGLAMLNFIPQSGTSYYISTADGTGIFALPEVQASGTQIQGSIKEGRIRYQINGGASLDGLRLCAFDRLNGLIEYRLNGKSAGLIQLDNAPEIVSLFLIGADGTPLSEATLSQPNTSEATKAIHSNKITVGDTLRYSLPQPNEGERLAVHIIADNVPATPMEAALKYFSDYQSDLPFPSESYNTDCDSRRDDIHIWLSSAHFKRFGIAEALKKKDQMYRYMPEDNLNFGGTVTYDNGHGLKGGSLVAYNTDNNNVYTADIDTKGHFRIAVDDFSEGISFYIEAVSAKGKSDFYRYEFDNDTFPDVGHTASQLAMLWQNTEKDRPLVGARPGFDNNGYNMLPEVEVKARVLPSNNIPSNKFYNINYIDRAEIEKKDYHSLLDMLYKMPGIRVIHNMRSADLAYDPDKPEYSIITTRGASTLGGSGEVLFLLDGARVYETDNILQMSAFEIESVELLQAWQTIQYVSGAIHGALLIKTRNADRGKNVRPKGVRYMPIGLASESLSPQKPADWVARRAGNYRLCIDVVSSSGIKSYFDTFTVEE